MAKLYFRPSFQEFRGHHTELAREAVLCVIGQVAWQSGSLGALCGRGGSGRRGVWRIRGHAARRVVGAARDSGADFILVAGDTFEENGVDRILVQKVADIVGSFGGPVYVIPGNHDPLVPGSVWDHPAWKASANVHVLREERPVEIPGGTLYPCPVRAKRSGRDPTAWIRPEEGQGIRVGLAHGTVEGVHQEEPDYPIARGAATRARLDYLALGHWDSTATYAGPDGTTRMAFQGTSTLFPKLTCHAALATAAG